MGKNSLDSASNFCLAKSCYPSMQFSEAEIYLLFAAALFLLLFVLCWLPIHQKSVVHFNSNAVLKVL